MTKSDLLGIFRTSINNCKLAYASLLLFSHEDMASFYGEWSARLDIPRPFDETEILALLNDREVSQIAFGQLYETVHRAAFKELFEVTKNYCEQTTQRQKLQRQSWFQFWRIIRNCLSHDFKFHFNDYDLTKLPVRWKTVTIDQTFEGKSLTHGDISREELLTFLNDVSDFIDNNLT